MQITFNPGRSEVSVMEFETKKSWEDYLNSCKAPDQPVPFNRKPEVFPCIMLYDGNLLPIEGEHTTFYNIFVYSYTNR